MLRRFGSVTVLNGHIHQIVQKVEGNITFHTARSTAYPQPAAGEGAGPGPLKVPADQLRTMLGVTSVSIATPRGPLVVGRRDHRLRPGRRCHDKPSIHDRPACARARPSRWSRCAASRSAAARRARRRRASAGRSRRAASRSTRPARLPLDRRERHRARSTAASSAASAGSVADYAYSPALKSSGLTWDEATLDRWLINPSALVPGTKMFFKIDDAQSRADLIAYLKQQK